MRFFFRSKQFRLILTVILALIAVSVACILIGGKMSPQASIADTVAAPVKQVCAKVTGTVKKIFAAYSDGAETMLKNAELESQINELREKISDYEQIKTENDFYKDYLGIKDQHKDFEFVPATLISQDKNDPFKGFTVNKGSSDGISEHDPVITQSGLVGYVSQVGVSTSKITTVLSPDISLGALDNRTRDAGVLYGSLDTSREGYTGLYNLPRSCNVAVGDYVITSGEGIFPEGLLIGSICSIESEKYNTSIFASVKPFVDPDSIKDVMIITSFKGQGGIDPSK